MKDALNIAIDYMNERLEEHDAKYQRHPAAEAERNNILADIETVKEALAQPERHELQSEGKHPAPCARFCEANAFQIEIRRLKAQLAQPKEPEQEQKMTFQQAAQLINEMKAQPEQEPVTKEMWKQAAEGALELASITTPPQRETCKVWDAEGYDALCQELELWKAQAKRKPLTDEQIRKLIIKQIGSLIGGVPFERFARAIEAAHGIKS